MNMYPNPFLFNAFGYDVSCCQGLDKECTCFVVHEYQFSLSKIIYWLFIYIICFMFYKVRNLRLKHYHQMFVFQSLHQSTTYFLSIDLLRLNNASFSFSISSISSLSLSLSMYSLFLSQSNSQLHISLYIFT